MKALYISFLIFLMPINMFAQWENLTTTSDSNFVPLSVGNVWQYLKTTYDSDGPSYSLSYKSVEADTTIGNLQYYHISDHLDLVRYSIEEKKMYVRWNDSDYVHIDFNIPNGISYQSFIGGGYRTVYAEAGEENIFGLTRPYGGYLYIPGLWGYMVLYTDSIGMSFDRSADSHLDVRRNVIQAIIYDSTGSEIFFTNHHKPIFEITPIIMIDTIYFNLPFKVRHYNTKLIGNNQPPWHSGLDFIDSVKMFSFYSKDDSVINNSPIIPIHTNNPVNFDYLISIQLDTVLMKDGFTFNYQFFAKDKGIIPEYSNSPDSGYYQCIWDETTDIEGRKNFLFNFSLNQNYPNPFNPVTKIKYTIPQDVRGKTQEVSLKVYNVLGREIATLVNAEKPAGEYEVDFNGSNLPSGIYFYRIKAGDFIKTKKMVLLR